MPALSTLHPFFCGRHTVVSSGSLKHCPKECAVYQRKRSGARRRRALSIKRAALLSSVSSFDGLETSSLCFGTMLFGEGTSTEEAHRLLSAAEDCGINFFDSAEMYPVPQSAATQGASERILGAWLRKRRRENYVVATKVTGPSGQMAWIRDGPAALDRKAIAAAVDGSLCRLQTDFIDLYQLHWPDRYVPMFGEVDYDPRRAYASVGLAEQLDALGAAVAAGKVLRVGLSNETPWGLTTACHLARTRPELPKPVTIQNAYSLLCRTFDAGLAECCHEEGMRLLAYSPLAMGLLTGKYLAAGGGPPGARLNRYRGRYAEAESRYGPRPNVLEATRAYVALAAAGGLAPAALGLRFVLSRPLVAGAVVGATSESQLRELAAAAAAGPLSPELLHEIDKIHDRNPNPAP